MGVGDIIGGLTSGAAQGIGIGSALKQKRQDATAPTPGNLDPSRVQVMGGSFDSYKKGGRVKKTGLAKLHKGERVLTKSQAKRYKGK